MATKSNLYTKGGDKGETSLVGGQRLSKSHIKIEVYGEIDHLNSMLGHFLSLGEDSYLMPLILKTQNNLFVLGSLYACEKGDREKHSLPTISHDDILELEKAIDEMDDSLPKLKNFILPGGDQSASWMHLCRTHTRRVERLIVEYEMESKDVIQDALIFVNRFSDFCFAAARWINHKKNIKETIWG